MDLKKKALLARVWSLWGCVLLAPMAAVAQEAAVEVVEVDCTVPLQAFMNPEVCRLGGTSSESKSVSSVSTPQVAPAAAAPVAPPLPPRQGGGGGNGAPGNGPAGGPGNGPAGGGGGNGPQPPQVGVPPVVNPLVQPLVGPAAQGPGQTVPPSQQPPARTLPPVRPASPASSHHSSESEGSEDSSGMEELNVSVAMNMVAHDLQDPDLTLDDIRQRVTMAARLVASAERMRQNAGEDFDAPELDAAQRNLNEAVRAASARVVAAENLRRAARGARVEDVLEDDEEEGGNEQATGSVVPPLHQLAAFGRAPSPTLAEMMDSVAEDLRNPQLTPAQREVIEEAASMLMERAVERGADLADDAPESQAFEQSYNNLEQALENSWAQSVPIVQVDLSGEVSASPRQVLIEPAPLDERGMQALDLEGGLAARPAAPDMPLSARGPGGVKVDIDALRTLAAERQQARRPVAEEEDYEDDFEVDSSVGDAADIGDILSLSGLEGDEVVVAGSRSAPPPTPTSGVDEAEVIVIDPRAMTVAAQRLQQEEAEKDAMRARMAQQPTLAERVDAFAALRDQIPAESPLPLPAVASVSGRDSVSSVDGSQPPRSVVVDTSLTPETTPRALSTPATPTAAVGSAFVPPLNLAETRKRVTIQEPEEEKRRGWAPKQQKEIIPLSLGSWDARERVRELTREDTRLLEERVGREIEREIEDEKMASPRTSPIEERNAAWAQAYQEGLRDPEYPERGILAGVFSPPEVAYDVDAAPTVTNQPTSVLAVGTAVTPRHGAAASAREDAKQRMRELFAHMETLARNPENSPEAIFTAGVNMVREIAQTARPNDRQPLEMMGIKGVDNAIDRGQVSGAEERLAQLSGLTPLVPQTGLGERVVWVERAVQVARQKAEEEGREASSSNSVPLRKAVDQTAGLLIEGLWRLHRGTPEGEEIIRLDRVVFPPAEDSPNVQSVDLGETPREEEVVGDPANVPLSLTPRSEVAEGDSQAELARELQTAFADLESAGSREALKEAFATYLAVVGTLEAQEIGVRGVSPALAARLEQAQTALTTKLVEDGEDVSDLPKWQEALGGVAAPAVAAVISPRSAASEEDDYADDDFEEDDDEVPAPAAAPLLTVSPPTPHADEEWGMLTLGGRAFDDQEVPADGATGATSPNVFAAPVAPASARLPLSVNMSDISQSAQDVVHSTVNQGKDLRNTQEIKLKLSQITPEDRAHPVWGRTLESIATRVGYEWPSTSSSVSPVVVVPVREDVVVDGALHSVVVPVPVGVLPQEVTGPLSPVEAVREQVAATDAIVESVRAFQEARASGDPVAIQEAQVGLVDAADHAAEVLAVSPPPATPQQQQVATEAQVAAAMAKDVVAMTTGGTVQKGRFEVRDIPASELENTPKTPLLSPATPVEEPVGSDIFGGVEEDDDMEFDEDQIGADFGGAQNRSTSVPPLIVDDVIVKRHNAIVQQLKDANIPPVIREALERERDALRTLAQREGSKVHRCGEDLQSGPCEDHEIE